MREAQGRLINRVTTLIRRNLTAAASGSTNILLRFNGRTRRKLHIACAAPGPCSAVSSVPHHTNRGSLNGIRQLTLPFVAFEKIVVIIANCLWVVNTYFSERYYLIFGRIVQVGNQGVIP